MTHLKSSSKRSETVRIWYSLHVNYSLRNIIDFHFLQANDTECDDDKIEQKKTHHHNRKFQWNANRIE